MKTDRKTKRENENAGNAGLERLEMLKPSDVSRQRKRAPKHKLENCVYFIIDTENRRLSYIGFTSRGLERRLRCHRGEIKGGAKYTRRFAACKWIAAVHGFTTKSLAMSFEWHAKRRRPKSQTENITGYHPRLSGFFAPLLMPKFKSEPLRVRFDSDVTEAACRNTISWLPASDSFAFF